MKSPRYSGDSISDTLWMSVSAAVAGVFVLTLLSGVIYLFDPAGKQIIEKISSIV